MCTGTHGAGIRIITTRVVNWIIGHVPQYNANIYFLQIARIVESKNSEYPKGKIVTGSMGWTTYSVVDPGTTQVRL